MGCPAGLGPPAELTGEGGTAQPRAKSNPSSSLQVPLWPPGQKAFTAFPAACVCEQGLACFPSRLFAYPDGTGSTSGERNVQLGWLHVCSPVSQLADGAKEVSVRTK